MGTVSYTDKTAKHGTKYTYAVSAISGNNESSYSEITRYHVARGVITKTKSSKHAIKVSWRRSSKVTGYQVQYSTKASFKNAKKKTYRGKNTKYAKLTGLKSGKRYYVRVRSYIQAGGRTYYGSWSAAKKISTGKDNK